MSILENKRSATSNLSNKNKDFNLLFYNEKCNSLKGSNLIK